MTKVLVAYASKHRSTAEIAQAIAEVLRQSPALEVDIRSVEIVGNVSTYDAVVLGSAVYAGQWQSVAAAFLRKHEAELARRPVWLFSSGPTGEGDPKTLMKGWNFPEQLQPLAERIRPRDIILFHGNLDPNRLNFLEQFVVKGVHAPMGDSRDWNMIRAWAAGIAQTLEAETRSVLSTEP
jgi:menaquinone-dependent protoporphyrinogen oxidase